MLIRSYLALSAQFFILRVIQRYIPFSIFHIQLANTINSAKYLILLSQSFLKNGKNVSLFLIMSIIIQKIEKIIKRFVKMPKGLIKIELINLPCNNCKVALVEPQAGQGIPVMFLNTQTVCPSIESEKL